MTSSNLQTKQTISAPNVLSLLDFCKGLAIIWVFLIHYKHIEGGWFGWQGVHIFIILSGFGLTYSCLQKSGSFSWKQWYLKRAEKILPSYWLIVSIGFLLILSNRLYKYIVYNESITPLVKPFAKLVLDVLLLRNFFEGTMSSLPNPALWFIPFIVSFYLIFPWLYNRVVKYKTASGYILILLAAALVEFIYRAIAIYWFDNTPIGYNDALEALHIPYLQLNFKQIFFGFFPSRIAEFVIGMIGANILLKNPQEFNNKIINYKMTIVGIVIWLVGNLLLYVGLWGWIFADFVIAMGLILWMLNLAWAFQTRFSLLFSGLSWLGVWSYYIYLNHYIFLDIHGLIENKSNLPSWIAQILMLGFMIVGMGIASRGLGQFDKSKFAKAIARKSIGVFLT